MKEIFVNWSDLKDFVDDKQISIQYLDIGGIYHLRAVDEVLVLGCELKKTATPGSDQLDFENNYKDDANKKIKEIDDEGRQISRIAAGKKGWTYLAHPIEITTSTIDGAFSADYTGTARIDFDMKLYDAQDAEITVQATADTDCVKTVVTFKPLYDYEIISGNIHQCCATTEDIRIWVLGGAFAVASNTPISVKEFVGGLNLKNISVNDHIETDGRASKLMVKDITSKGLPFPTYQGNCFQFIIRHPAGEKHDIMTVLEYFRA